MCSIGIPPPTPTIPTPFLRASEFSQSHPPPGWRSPLSTHAWLEARGASPPSKMFRGPSAWDRLCRNTVIGVYLYIYIIYIQYIYTVYIYILNRNMNKIRQKFAVGCSPNNHLIYGAVFRVTFKTLRCFSHFSTQSHRTGTWVDNAYTHRYKYTHNELYLHIQMYRAHTFTNCTIIESRMWTYMCYVYIYVCMYVCMHVCVLMCYIYKRKYIHIYM